MAARTRPKLDPATAKALRAYLRAALGRTTDPRVVDAVIRSSLDKIRERVRGNHLRVWDLAWDVDVFACRRRTVGQDDGGTWELAQVLYDYAEALDEAGIIRQGPRATRWRDAGGVPASTIPVGPAAPRKEAPVRAGVCGCATCRWEQPHGGSA